MIEKEKGEGEVERERMRVIKKEGGKRERERFSEKLSEG